MYFPRTHTVGEHTNFLGLCMCFILQLAEVGVLLGQQHFDVLHTHPNDPGAYIWLQSVNTLVGQKVHVADNRHKETLSSYTQHIK